MGEGFSLMAEETLSASLVSLDYGVMSLKGWFVERSVESDSRH